MAKNTIFYYWFAGAGMGLPVVSEDYLGEPGDIVNYGGFVYTIADYTMEEHNWNELIDEGDDRHEA